MMKQDGVSNIKLVKYPMAPTNKGYGFFTVETQEQRDNYVKNDNIVFCGRKLKFDEYVNQHKFYKLHVSNIPENLTEQELYNAFSKYGAVDNVRRDVDYVTKKPKMTACVVYNNYDDFGKVLNMKQVKYDDTTTFDVTKRRMNKFHHFPVMKQQTQQTQQTQPTHKLRIQRKQHN